MNENESDFVTFLIQTRILIWKNFLLFRRKLRLIMFILLTPWSVSIMLEVIIDIGKILNETGVVDFPVETVNKVPQCNNGYYWDPTDTSCLSVGYSLIGDTSNLNDPKY